MHFSLSRSDVAVKSLRYLVPVAAIFNCTLSLSMCARLSSNKRNAPAARRILGYQCSNPHCGNISHNVFAYNQHRTHETKRGTLCESITMSEEITGLCRSDTSTAALSARPTTGRALISCITVPRFNRLRSGKSTV